MTSGTCRAVASVTNLGAVNTGRVLQMGREECLALLGAEGIGRVVYTTGALPAAQPVAYVLDEDEVLFGTPGAGELAEATRDTVVAFEADRIDRGSGAGWTVLAVGETYDVTDPARVGALARCVPAGFGGAHRVVALPLARLTGRVFEVP